MGGPETEFSSPTWAMTPMKNKDDQDLVQPTTPGFEANQASTDVPAHEKSTFHT
jgi:hypothetical protein